MENTFQLVKKLENNLLHSRPIKLGKYATHDHAEKMATIGAYLNSQHISGSKDSLDREKPFFNVVLFSVYTWYKMTDIDRKDITFRAANTKQRLKAILASIKLRLWMNKKNIGAWLNKWGLTLSQYGSAITKFVEKDGKLIPSVIAWDRMICDPLDFINNPKVEKLYYTPAQLRQLPYDKDKIEEAINCFQEARETIEGEDIDVKSEYIGVYELHGNLPLSYLTNKEEDENTYRQQMHVLFIQKSPKDKKKETHIDLYSGKEEKDPYYISHLIDVERTLAVGAVESLFDTQWMVNHSIKQAKDQLDYSSKNVSQTADSQFLGRNILTDIETGDVLIHKENQPLTQVNTQSHDIPQITNFLISWKELGKEITGVHDAITGKTMPSGTPYRLGAMLSEQARGLFDIMKQNKSLHLEEMMRIYILPYFKKTLKNADELVATLDGEELEQVDSLLLPAKLEQELMARLMLNHIPNEEELMMAVGEQNSEMGNVRILKPGAKTWAEYFKNFEWDVEIDIAGENRDKSSILSSLDALLQRMLSAPNIFSPDDVKKVFNRIVDEIGTEVLSPLQLKGQGVLPDMGTTGGELPPEAMSKSQVGMPNLTPTI